MRLLSPNGLHAVTTTAPIEIVALKAQGYSEITEGEETPKPTRKPKAHELMNEEIV